MKKRHDTSFEQSVGIVGRIWPRHRHRGRPLNWVVSRLIAMVLAYSS